MIDFLAICKSVLDIYLGNLASMAKRKATLMKESWRRVINLIDKSFRWILEAENLMSRGSEAKSLSKGFVEQLNKYFGHFYEVVNKVGAGATPTNF